jgi:hypothetical protein
MPELEMSKTVYYRDELNDEFSGFAPKGFYIGADYHYIHRNPFYRFFSFLAYRLVMTPIAFFYSKFAERQKIANRKVLRPYRKRGYFIYGNHTQLMGGGFTPSLVCFPKRTDIIVNPDNLAVKGCKTLFEMSGAVPLPSALSGVPPFLDCLQERCREGHAICVYPEAHIWPYCTKIRHFKAASFRYPCKMGTPVFAFTDCYKRRRHSKKPRIVTYVDGPFFPNEALSGSSQADDLRNQVYDAMRARSEKESVYSVIDYVKKEDSKA